MSSVVPQEQAPRELIRILLIAVVVGVLGAVGASAFLWIVEQGQLLIFNDLPKVFGLDQAPWWWVGIMLAIGASLVALARRLPGATGQGPLTGFHFDDPPKMVPSVLLAALATLIFGFALGPEAPLIVVGTTIGAFVARRASDQGRRAAMALGAFAAIGAVFGNPFVTGFMLLEFIALGMMPSAILVPAFVALATSYIAQIGIWGIPGVGIHPLAVPGMPVYDSIGVGALGVGTLVAIAAGVIALVVRYGAAQLDRVGQRRPVPTLYLAAAITTAVVLVTNGFLDIPLDQILFNGSSGMSTLVAETSVGVVLVILVGKSLAYGSALGGGLRGGPIFPATFLGVAVGVIGSLVFSDMSVTPLAAAGIAASCAAFLGLPATSAALGWILVAGAGAAVAPFAILGSLVGILIRRAAQSQGKFLAA